MRITRADGPICVVHIMVLSALAVGIGWAAWHLDRKPLVLAESCATITFIQPDGVDDVVGNGDDFATTVFGDPWDMSHYTDVPALHGVPGGMIGNGVLTYTVLNPSDLFVHIPLLHPGAWGAIDAGIKVGSNYPINTNHYRWLSLHMNQPGGYFTIRWFYDKDLSNCDGSTTDIYVSPGWHTYVVDLETVSKSSGSWQGQVIGLFVMVGGAPVGTTGAIDWVRLTATNPADNGLGIAWSGLSPSSRTIDFYVDPDDTGCDGTLIQTEWSAPGSGSFTWQQPADDVASPANVMPGDYYVCAKERGSDTFYGRSAGLLTVNQAPIIHFTQPGWTSGEDYATAAGNPWDMNDAADVHRVINGSYVVNGGILAVTVPASESDVQVYMNVPTAIDRSRYHYISYRLWFEYDYGWMDVGQGARVFWGRSWTETQSGWIYDYPGWQTYCMDLSELPLVSGPVWSTADWSIFRIDPIANNTGQQVNVYLDDVTLTGDEQADASTNVEWELTDPDSPVTTMALYYDDDASGLDGTPIITLTLTNGEQPGTLMSIAETLASLQATTELTRTVYIPLAVRNYVPPCAGACYTWYTGHVAPGAYYLYACVDDGYNRLCRYSDRPLNINHP